MRITLDIEEEDIERQVLVVQSALMKRQSLAVPAMVVVLSLAGCKSPTAIVKNRPCFIPAPDTSGLYQVKKDGKWGLIDKEGQIVVPPQFDQLMYMYEGLASVCIGPCKFVKTNPDEPSSLDELFQGKFGAIDSTGKLVITPRFTMLWAFHNGLAQASSKPLKLYKNDEYLIGYVNREGAFVIPEQFISAGDFDEAGMAKACIGNSEAPRCGYIDKTGTYAINPQYYAADDFRDDRAMVTTAKDAAPSYIDRSGKLVWKGD